MKTIPIALASHYDEETTTVCACLKVTRSDGVVVGFTELDVSIDIDGVTYHSGFMLSSLSSTETLAVDNMELTFLALDDLLPESDLLSGLWNNAAFEVFVVNYKALDESPGPDRDILKRGTTGEVQLRNGMYVIEFRSMTQALQQTQGIVTSKTCRARLGDGKCKVDLAPYTFTGALTAVTDARSFADSGRGQAEDYFAEGIFAITSGVAAGFSQKVKAFTAGGNFLLSLSLPYTPAVGDTYTVVAGCRKRLMEDCKAKFDNVLNFQGEPHLPGLDKLTSRSTSSQPASPFEVSDDPIDYGGGVP